MAKLQWGQIFSKVTFESVKYELKVHFFSESTDVFVITSNGPIFFFPETDNLNFGD